MITPRYQHRRNMSEMAAEYRQLPSSPSFSRPTHALPRTALTVWMIIDWCKMKRPSLVGVCVGAIAGLATITPCAGFVQPWAAFVIGIIAAVFCYGCCELKNYCK